MKTSLERYLENKSKDELRHIIKFLLTDNGAVESLNNTIIEWDLVNKDIKKERKWWKKWRN